MRVSTHYIYIRTYIYIKDFFTVLKSENDFSQYYIQILQLSKTR